jgi:hypothetical protein
MTIVFTEDVIGVTNLNKNYSNYYSKSFGGFIRYIQRINKNIKKIGIIHFSNVSPSNHYGEGLFEDTPILELPTIMWHYETGKTIGLTLTASPLVKILPNLETQYRDLIDRFGNVVGKVFNDLKIFVIEDQELLFAMSYKSNRNWTLPAPSLSLISPNVCDNDSTNDVGFLTGNSETLWVTYRFNSSTKFTNSLHCNYYEKIEGPSIDCFNINQNVAIKFGDEFKFLKQNSFTGFNANEFNILCQKVKTGERPETNKWRRIDFTSQLNATKVNGFITSGGLLTSTFIVTKSLYDSAEIYDLTNYIKV